MILSFPFQLSALVNRYKTPSYQRIGVCQSIVTASVEDPNGYKFEKNDLRTLGKVMLQLKILKVISFEDTKGF
ncbi:unnamed protein product [Trifolium pratense]|uniref:Uncharacterized protein n=1 Tax=Trifolium pratense TaxID=57577 RepID=A0ACB0IUG7_TRIPR|nr:unnamed protein product [Trifolium pratense]